LTSLEGFFNLNFVQTLFLYETGALHLLQFNKTSQSGNPGMTVPQSITF
jgi:hypothetical protein